MFFRILKKDLKRKKVMNVIILLFVTLSTLFVASSMNNIVTVVNGLDYFFDKADLPDIFAVSLGETGDGFLDTVNTCSGIDTLKTEEMISNDGRYLTVEGNTEVTFTSMTFFMPIDNSKLNYFDENNEKVTKIEKGKALVAYSKLSKDGFRVGDVFVLDLNGTEKKLEIVGGVKDVLFGSKAMGNDRIFINEADYEEILAAESDGFLKANIYYAYGEDTSEFEKEVRDENSIAFYMTRENFKSVYMMDMIVAGLLLVISVCLILVAFLVLRFTIAFTMNEEFREIGVMKAIGITNRKIRFLYILKYLMLASVGALVGFFGSIPLASVLLDTVSREMVLGNENATFINLSSSIFVVAVIVAFCFACTRKVKKLAPVDAVRDGSTGERFTKKRGIRIGKMHGKTAFFLAVNDVLCSIRRYITAIIAFSLCLLMLLTLVNAVNTISSKKCLPLLGMKECDLEFVPADLSVADMMRSDFLDVLKNENAETERLLKENGMPGRCWCETLYKLNFNHGDNSFKSNAWLGVGTTADEYTYYEGTAPQNANEIAIAPLVAEKLGVTIGNTVTVTGLEGREFIVTALFQSIMNMGEGVRFHEDTDLEGKQVLSVWTNQIGFDDAPDSKTIARRAEELKVIFGVEEVMTGDEMSVGLIGVSDVVDPLITLMTALTLIIVALVTVLMERSFISSERSEIALEKAIGLGSGTVIKHHTLRFGVIGTVSVTVALLLAIPVTKLCITPIFGIFGLTGGIDFAIKPLEIFVIYPALVLATTMVFAFLTSLWTKRIKSSDTSSIE